jgi:hypothetical protein
VLVDLAQLSEDLLDAGTPVAVETAVDGLEVRVGEDGTVLTLLVLDGPQQFLESGTA